MIKRKDIPDYKQELYKRQNKRCALTGVLIEDVNKAHLDHDHKLDGPGAGRCRGLLLGQANVLEGRFKHQFERSGLAGKIGYIDFLKNLVCYLEADYTANPRHPQLIPELIKRFSRMNLNTMRQKLLECHQEASGTKQELTHRYKKYLRSKYENKPQGVCV